MDNDLFFGTETSDMLTGGTPGDDVQLAAASAENLPPFDDALTRPFDAAQVVIPQGENIVREPVTPGEVVELPFPADSQFLARIDNGNLAIKVGDVTVILQGYVEAAGQAAPVIEASNGQPLDIATILASTDPNIDIQTAAGPAAGPQGQGADNTGGILQQFGEGAGLGGFTGAGALDATDGLGGGTVDQTGTLFVLFGTLAENAVPTLQDDAYKTNEDVALNVAAGTGLLSNDSDPDGDPLTVISFTAPAHGTVVVNPDGSFTYTPNKDYNGPDSFDYTASDGKGGTGTATVNITVNPVNDAPVANDDSYLAIQNKGLVVTAADGLLKNDTDVDGDALTASKVTDPAHGTVTVNADGSFTYTPNVGYFGKDSFTYQADDGHGGKSTATVELYVDAPPKWAGGFFDTSFDEDTPNHPQALGWTITDADDTKFTITVDPTTLPDGVTYDAATKTINFDTQGKYDYLVAGEKENFTIKFTITDEHGGTSTKDVTLEITGVNDAPVTVADTVLNDGTDGTWQFPLWALAANDKDPDSSSLLVNDIGGFKGTGHEDITGNPSTDVPYTVTDGLVTSAPGTVHFNHDTDGVAGTTTGTASNDIIGGRIGLEDTLKGGGGDDIIAGFGGGDHIFGEAGDDTLVFKSVYGKDAEVHGGTDNVATKDGLEGGAAMHGDVLAVADAKLDFSDHASVANIDGIETISTQEKVGGFGAQSVTIGAASVQDLSDHTITPGGVFPEKDAVRIDGDAVDQLYLSISKDGGNWADTGTVVNGYHVFAHEVTAGVEASTDAYVMVQQANVANVHLNADAP